MYAVIFVYLLLEEVDQWYEGDVDVMHNFMLFLERLQRRDGHSMV